MRKTMQSHKQVGFTLIELMIVLVIVAILAAVAYPSYQEQVERGRLAEGKAVLTQAATRMERCYSTKGTYKNCISSAVDSETGMYAVSVKAPAADNTFTLVATRKKATGANQCGNLTLTQTGKTDVESATKTAAECWR
jgi:type IV pilus assembly protein PilE